MDSTMILIILATALVSIGLGVLIASTLLKSTIEKKASLKLKEAEMKAEALKNEKMLQAKEKFLQLKTEHEKTIGEKNQLMVSAENRIKPETGTSTAQRCGTGYRSCQYD
jgi:ribonuclease Y